MVYIRISALQGPTIVNYVRAAAGETDDLLNQRLAAADISLPQLELLDHLARLSGPAPLGRLAELLECSRSNVTQLVDRLQRRGLIWRMVDARDRRTVLARLTSEGIRRHDTGLEVVIDLERDLRGAFSGDVLRQLLSGLAELRDAASDSRTYQHT